MSLKGVDCRTHIKNLSIIQTNCFHAIHDFVRVQFHCSDISAFFSAIRYLHALFISNRGLITSVNVVIVKKEFGDIDVQPVSKKRRTL